MRRETFAAPGPLRLDLSLPAGEIELEAALVAEAVVELELVRGSEAAAAPAAEDGLSSRITLRLPEQLKGSIEAAAAREGVSVNAWLVRALARSVSSPPRRQSGSRLTGFGKS